MSIENNKLFENIAITLSGGGYRASSFALGVLSYLNHFKIEDKPLLKNVKGISAVSGGTLTGVTYAFFVANGNSFSNFYSHFYSVLENDNLIAIASEKLSNNNIWKTINKRRTLINAMSLAYEELLIDGTFKNLTSENSHLEDICFNATDFSNGLSFRFQTTGVFGNNKFKDKISKNCIEKLKLSDIIAASSCFPIGFEPIIFPNDFINKNNLQNCELERTKEIFDTGIGLMDGGIVDNQGIGSMINADKRRHNNPGKKEFDLVMVCDVGSYTMEPWKPEVIEEDKGSNINTPLKVIQLYEKVLKNRWWLIAPLFFIIAFSYYLNVTSNFNLLSYFGTHIISLVVIISVLILVGISYVKYKVYTIKNFVLDIVPDELKKELEDELRYLGNLKFNLLKRMIIERATSSKKMINEVLMKQIRRLNYNLFYADERFKNRRITNLIYEITKGNNVKSNEKTIEYNSIKKPSKSIIDATVIAEDMPTTFWFTKKDTEIERLKNLVACGQFTTCYNLLAHCMYLKNKNINSSPLLDVFISKLKDDWTKFNENPYWLHDDNKI